MDAALSAMWADAVAPAGAPPPPGAQAGVLR